MRPARIASISARNCGPVTPSSRIDNCSNTTGQSTSRVFNQDTRGREGLWPTCTLVSHTDDIRDFTSLQNQIAAPSAAWFQVKKKRQLLTYTITRQLEYSQTFRRVFPWILTLHNTPHYRTSFLNPRSLCKHDTGHSQIVAGPPVTACLAVGIPAGT